MNPIRSLLGAVLAVSLSAGAAMAQAPVRWLSQSQAVSTQFPVENAAMERITTGLNVRIERSEFQGLGINMADALRLVRAGTFDVVSAQIGLASRDDPFLEGIDLIGVSTDLEELRGAVNAFREVFDARIQQRFGAKVVAIWPFGSQVFFCSQPIRTLDDLRGQRVRSFTASMSQLLERLGATPVTLSFPEVYPALQRGVASCGITSPTSANTGKWPEVTTHLLPLSVSGAVQAHLVNLAWWNRQTPAQRDAYLAQFTRMENDLWELARTTNEDATNCSLGRPECLRQAHQPFNMTLATVSEADKTRLRRISEEVILSEWAARCNRAYPGCAQVWNDTVGRARGMAIR
ncbi:TRAP transporter substrate-binding protein [Falsiroseomonas stagni]|uniref:TRAP-type C4-dicarboxylate transport system, substrate-binding protein n=1 Tax=Falsiroseomonas stagni DSM 19981 TaxID=1123062 RepID=A0A1I4CF40_9PROT|nr:TRAP transporter substrate-binding protein [Falsiroseomonas stagni]SFK78917.1 TRAP-type C4-dicarboxylate transport system, substrate-binding protein [Falsiroseomonas stagni DSM 19981]